MRNLSYRPLALAAGDGTLGLLTWKLTSDANDLRRLPRLGELGMSAAARGRGLSAWIGVYWDVLHHIMQVIAPALASAHAPRVNGSALT